MIYGLLDFEYDKHGKGDAEKEHPEDYFSTNPYLYAIGMQGACYSNGTFLKYVLYGIFHAFIIYWSVFYVLSVPG